MEEDVKKPVSFSFKTPGHKIADFYKGKGSEKRAGAGYGNDKDIKGKRDDKKPAYVSRMVAMTTVQAVVGAHADKWVVASGATHHLSTEKANFFAMAHADDAITPVSDGKLSAHSRGEATLLAEGAEIMTAISLKNAYRVPGIEDDIMSVGRVVASGEAVLVAHRRCFLFDHADVAAPPEVIDESDAQGILKAYGQYTLGPHGAA
eukprot:contig_8400_g1967